MAVYNLHGLIQNILRAGGWETQQICLAIITEKGESPMVESYFSGIMTI